MYTYPNLPIPSSVHNTRSHCFSSCICSTGASFSYLTKDNFRNEGCSISFKWKIRRTTTEAIACKSQWCAWCASESFGDVKPQDFNRQINIQIYTTYKEHSMDTRRSTLPQLGKKQKVEHRYHVSSYNPHLPVYLH